MRGRTDQIARQLRELIVLGNVEDGQFLGTVSELVAQCGVSRPSLREALKLLEGEGLVTISLGVRGGVIAHRPDEWTVGRALASVLSTRRTDLADIVEARARMSGMVAGQIAATRGRRSVAAALRRLIPEDSDGLDSAEFYAAGDAFAKCLIQHGPNESIGILATALHDRIAEGFGPAFIDATFGSASIRRREIRAHRQVTTLLESGADVDAEDFWRRYQLLIGQALLKRSVVAAVPELPEP